MKVKVLEFLAPTTDMIVVVVVVVIIIIIIIINPLIAVS